MATFAGAARSDSPIASYGQAPEFEDVQAPWEVLASSNVASGLLDRNLPTTFQTRVISGSVRRRSTFDDYYNRIWLIPSVIDFGSLSSTQTALFTVWNAYLTPIEISSIDEPSDPSLTLSAPAVGVQYKPLQVRTGSLIASQDGDPSVDALFTFVFDNADYATMSVVGTRARFWEFAPNWDEGMDVTLEYRTEVQTSHKRKETRIAGRQTARKTVEYQSIVPQRVFRSMLGFMNSNQNRLTMVPEFSRGAHLAFDVAAGTAEIEVEETVDWLVVGQTVTLYAGGIAGYRSDLRKIISVTGNVAELSAAVDGDWSAGSKVYPVVSGYLSKSISASMLNNNTARLSISLEVSPGSEPVIDPGAPEFTFDGRELFLKRPDWSSTPTVNFESIRNDVDYGIGRTAHFFPVDFNSRMSKATYLGRDREDAEAFIRFFRRQMGQQGEFFMPTYTEDMIVKGSVDSLAFTLRVEGDSIARDFDDLSVYRHIIIFFNNGTHLIRRVETVGVINDIEGVDSGLVMSETWGIDFEADDVLLACWLPLWRFASDSLAISWLTDEVAQFAVNLKSLEYEEAE